jgi:hypothetical protein
MAGDRKPNGRPSPGTAAQHNNTNQSKSIPPGGTGPSPYAMAWERYVTAGWQGVIPIRTTHDGKSPPVAGFTGREHCGVYPSLEQMQAWAAAPRWFSDIALRLPDDVVGIDCDAYGGKHGDQTMAEAVERWGGLPDTWLSTSRSPGEANDWPSGIYWFKVPPGLVWPGKLPGGDVEIISHGYRYAVVWPSVHPSGNTYVWWDPDDDSDSPASRVPSPDDFPELPETWIAGLTQGKRHDYQPPDEAREWLTAGEPCQAVTRVLDGFDGGSRHTAMLQGQVRLLRLGEQGHRGVAAALDTLEALFIDSVTGSRRGEVEWQRALDTAPAQIQGRTPPERRRCCPKVMTLDEQLRRFGMEAMGS